MLLFSSWQASTLNKLYALSFEMALYAQPVKTMIIVESYCEVIFVKE